MRREASMDTRFVWELQKQLGLKVWCDTTIKVGHINSMVIDDSYQYRFKEEEIDGYGSQIGTSKL